MSYWTTTEIAVMRRLYPTGSAEAVVAELPHRTINAIRSQANVLGASVFALAQVK